MMCTLVDFMLKVLSFLYRFTTKIGKEVRKYGGKEQNNGIFAITRMDLEKIMLCEIGQTQKDKSYVISLI